MNSLLVNSYVLVMQYRLHGYLLLFRYCFMLTTIHFMMRNNQNEARFRTKPGGESRTMVLHKTARALRTT